MASSSNFRLSKNLSAITTSSIPNSESNPRNSSPLSNDRNNQNLHETDSEPRFHKHKASTQLDRWFRARAIRNGRRLDRHGPSGKTAGMIAPINGGNGLGFCHSPEKSNEKDNGEKTTMKVIYMVSSGTGWTVKHSVTAVLGQFEHYLTDLGCAVNTHLFSGINDVERLMEIIKQAGKEGAMLFYTLAEPSMRESAKQGCKLWGVPSTDILSPITEAVAAHLNISPSGTPCKAPACRPLTKEYFQRIEAIEFTIKQDDGALPQNLHRADIVLSGVSRTGKTPLSIYLAQMGYKVANVPIVKGVELPKTLFELEPNKVFGLTINPVVLHTIRRVRAKSLGFDDHMQSNYSELEHVREELEFASSVFAKNPKWSVIEMTGKAIEETAAVVLRLFNDGKQKCSTPQFSNSFS